MKRKDGAQREKADKLMEVETQQTIGCKMRFLFGYEKGKTFATITTSKEEVDYQFWYPGRNKVIGEYKNIKDDYSWNNEDDSELVYTEPVKSTYSPKIYDLRTPLKKSKGGTTLKFYYHLIRH